MPACQPASLPAWVARTTLCLPACLPVSSTTSSGRRRRGSETRTHSLQDRTGNRLDLTRRPTDRPTDRHAAAT
ncbi:hypothetical protein F4780DRAFT_718809 [Xylariomycetidae sp. FL0641]|nr:hypothetical protein F4780DRAFT_718809 [Xylariomycetidae sp. FL0641]